MTDSTHAIERKEANLHRWEWGAFLVGAVLFLISFVMIFTGDRQAVVGQGYLWAFIFWGCMTLGFFGLTLLHHTVRGAWGTSIMRLLEAGGGPGAITFMAIVFLPLAMLIATKNPLIYTWLDQAAVAKDHILQHKSQWLNPTGVLGRTALFLILWYAFARYLRNSTLKQDELYGVEEGHLPHEDQPGVTVEGEKPILVHQMEERKRTNLSAPGIVLFFVTVTFALTDWLMSVDYHWFSTMFGPWLIVGSTLGAFCLCTAIVCANADKLPYAKIVTPALTRDLGNLILTNLLLWTYVSFSQYLIIWSGNLPEFTNYYVERANGAWMWIPVTMIFLHFIFPFLLLLNPVNKRKPRNLMFIAIWLLLMRAVDTYWIVVGGFHSRDYPLQYPLTDIMVFIGVGLMWVAAFSMQVKRAPLLPRYDRRLEEAMHNHHA